MYKTPVVLMKRKSSLKTLIKLQIQSVDFDRLTILHLQNLDHPPASNTEPNLTKNLAQTFTSYRHIWQLLPAAKSLQQTRFTTC